ncbi:MAG: L-rhamnose mutarotase [Actinobacteria bacterium]|nr:L-rhamnose mutarotase [Actinomycetota bacterium]
MKTKRYCMVLEIKEECVNDYVNIHKNAWAELLKAEKVCGIKEELIWIYKNLSILFIECDDIDQVFKAIEANEIERKWDIKVRPWFKNSQVLDASKKIEALEKIFDLNQQLNGDLERY